MSLSARELQILKDMEEQLAAEDSRLSRTLGRNLDHQRAARLVAKGLATVIIGLSLMILALSVHAVPLGVIAFVSMTTSAYLLTLPSIRLATRRGEQNNNKIPRSTSPQTRRDGSGAAGL